MSFDDLSFEVKEQKDGKWEVIVRRKGSIETHVSDFPNEAAAQAYVDQQGTQNR
ncbi:MAG TPA: hypothetical protein VGH23_15430 [Rhizomicrobium sp.]